MPQVTSWTYKVECLPLWRQGESRDSGGDPIYVSTDVNNQFRLNQLGAEGWELIAAYGIGGRESLQGPHLLQVILKRPT